MITHLLPAPALLLLAVVAAPRLFFASRTTAATGRNHLRGGRPEEVVEVLQPRARVDGDRSLGGGDDPAAALAAAAAAATIGPGTSGCGGTAAPDAGIIVRVVSFIVGGGRGGPAARRWAMAIAVAGEDDSLLLLLGPGLAVLLALVAPRELRLVAGDDMLDVGGLYSALRLIPLDNYCRCLPFRANQRRGMIGRPCSCKVCNWPVCKSGGTSPSWPKNEY